jgi:hypothetical protein
MPSLTTPRAVLISTSGPFFMLLPISGMPSLPAQIVHVFQGLTPTVKLSLIIQLSCEISKNNNLKYGRSFQCIK